jgi:hypothetical protein
MRFHQSNVTILALALMLVCSGCYSTWDIPKSELGKLQSFRSPQSTDLSALDGTKVRFDQNTALCPTEQGNCYRFQAIDQVDDHGVSGQTTESVQVKRSSPSKTAGLIVGITVGVALIAGIALGVAVAHSSGAE